jgi:hypothetical protein
MKQEGGSMLEVKQHVKQIMKQRVKHIVKHLLKHVRKKNEKHPNLTCYIHGMLQIVTLAPVELLHFAEEKRPPHHCCLQQ